jgi:hypothetical protein
LSHTPASLLKLSIRDAEIIKDSASGQDVFHVRDAHALVQAAGYLKHVSAQLSELILFRGQARLYNSLRPSLFRSLKYAGKEGSWIGELNRVIGSVRRSARILGKFDAAVHEPLLQHYGLRTTWVDLVDNAWVALWFACYNAVGAGKHGEYLHFERRDPMVDSNPYAYVLLVAADAQRGSSPGIWTGPSTELVDLRAACPSIFLRPHAQYGVVFRVRGDTAARPLDYVSQVRGIIRADLAEALRWLGHGDMLGVHALFPPPYYDLGYRILLETKFMTTVKVGSINHVGA